MAEFRKPEIKTECGFYETWPEFSVNGNELDVDEIKEIYEVMIDALINVRKRILSMEDFPMTTQQVDKALTKAGCKING